MSRCVFVLSLLFFFGRFSFAGDTVEMALDSFGGAAVTNAAAKPYPRLAAEFEDLRVLVFGVSDWQPHHRKILLEIAKRTAGHVNLMILCNDTWQIKETTKWLLEDAKEYPHVYFCEFPLNSVWLRDFGPIFAETQHGALALDFYYEGSRPKDDALPAAWSRRSGADLLAVPWTIQGGNLISNGQGLALTTNRIFEDNRIRFPRRRPGQNVEIERRKMVVDEFVKFGNLSKLIVLEPLQSESTKHVDMFATFLSPSDVLLAEVDRHLDPVNAEILERNAVRLRRVTVGEKPLRVHRIRIPPRSGNSWSSYTNAVIAGDLVLMPYFESDPKSMVQAAVAQYRRLLPSHTIATIDMTSMKALQGELHCLSMHIPVFAPAPDQVYPFANSVKAYFPNP